MNEALLARADAAKLVKTGKVRADTTVVSANIEYPTDSGLLAHAVTLIGKLVARIKANGGARRTVFRDTTETAATMVHAIGAKSCVLRKESRRPRLGYRAAVDRPC